MKSSTPIYILKRQAKRLSRMDSIPWMEALHRVAQQEGYESWGLLMQKYQMQHPTTPQALLAALRYGELLLIASRPGFGKTRLSLDLLVHAAQRGRQCYFFSLDYTHQQVVQKLGELGAAPALLDALHIDCSNEISSAYIQQQTQHTITRGALLVVDYLQLLDLKRSNPPIQQQVEALRAYAKETESNVVFLSQIERAFEEMDQHCPSLEHVRLPNPLDLKLFHKGLFLHKEKRVFQELT